MRLITFTGKGGVGKTSVAAATALRLSEMGYRTLVMSTDPAHSLSDSFNTELSAEPRELKSNLHALEVNAYADLKLNWGVVQKHYAKLMFAQGVTGVAADEMTVLPGMEELFSLMRVKRYKYSGKYDAMILDTAPTGETLRLLSLPETLSWGIKMMRGVEKYFIKPIARPLSRLSTRLSDIVPPEEVMNTVDNMFTELDGVKEILTDRQNASVRLVMNAEKMVIKETMRALTYLNLYGFTVDMVAVNKLLAADEHSGYLEKWKAVQQKYLTEIHDSFAPLPIKKVQMYDEEVVGFGALARLAQDLYLDANPAEMMYTESPLTFSRTATGYEVKMKLPFATTDDLDIWVSGDELFVQIGNQRKITTLPIALTGIEPGEASLTGKWLTIPFPASPVASSVSKVNSLENAGSMISTAVSTVFGSSHRAQA